MTDTQPAQPEQQPPPGPTEAQWAAPESTSKELWVSWLLIVTFIVFPLVGLIWVIVDAPSLGYRRHDALFALIPIYGTFCVSGTTSTDVPIWRGWLHS